METREESGLSVLRLFGREPSVEDGRCVGRWAYAAAWLAEDRATARELARARLLLAATAATSVAMRGGRGDADRFALIGALARLPEALTSDEGARAPAAERAVAEAAERLLADGAAVRALTARERAAFAPRFNLEGFDAGLRELGGDRNVWLREAAVGLDEALLHAKGACPALRVLRLFLRATLALDPREATTIDPMPAGTGEPFTTLGLWLSADLALMSRRSGAYASAWAGAARASGDALSRTLAGLTSGAMQAHAVVEALAEDPFAFVLALGMTSEPEHAAAALDLGVKAQLGSRSAARAELSRWQAQAQRLDDLEGRLGIVIVVADEIREGHRDFSSGPNLDLFSAWHVVQTATDARAALRDATDQSLRTEAQKRREVVRRAKRALDDVRQAFDAAVDAAREKQADVEVPAISTPEEDAGAHQGCVYGFGAGCGVMATYAVVGVVLGTAGIVGQIAPLVVGVAALPVLAAIMVQVAHGLRRAARSAEAARRRAAASDVFEQARKQAERVHGASLAKAKAGLEEAEATLTTFERKLVETKAAA